MKEAIHSIILNSKDPVNELDIYFANKQNERDTIWAFRLVIVFVIALVLTVFIVNK